MIYCHISIKSPYNEIFLRTGTKCRQSGAKTTFYIFKYSIFYKIKKPILSDRLWFRGGERGIRTPVPVFAGNMISNHAP